MKICEWWNQRWKKNLEGRVADHYLLRQMTSHTVLAFCYGLFLFLYEVKFARDIVSPLHPLLIAWGGVLVLYDIFVRDIWKKIPHRILIFLFTVSTAVTTVLTREAGIVAGIKGMIFTLLPLYVFLPVCFSQEKTKRRNTLILSFLGASVVLLAASLAALGCYAIRFGGYVRIGPMREFVGMRFYIPTDPTTGILLYGFYVDTNHAAMFALAFAAYGIFLFVSGRKGFFDRKWKNIGASLFGIVSAAVQLCYFPMANSRAGWLALLIGAFAVVFFAGYCDWFVCKEKMPKFFLSCLAAAAAAVFVFFGMQALRGGVARLPELTDRVIAGIQAVHIPGVSGQEGSMETSTEPTKVPSESEEGKHHSDMQLADTGDVSEIYFDKSQVSADGSRLLIWKEVLQLFAKKPVFGTAPSGNQYYAQKYQIGLLKIGNGSAVHNSFLDLLLDYGIVGFALCMVFWGMCAFSVLCDSFKRKDRKNLPWFVSVFIIIVTLCGSVTLSCTFINTTAMYFLMIITASYLLADIQEMQER